MKLELKHLAPYLPYELQLLEEFEVNESKIRTLRGIDIDMVVTNLERFPYNQRITFSEIKPILRPLSDLTDEIDIHGDKIFPCAWFGLVPNEQHQQFLETKVIEGWMSYKEMTVLIKHHFDVFNLISEGLAIDINTIK